MKEKQTEVKTLKKGRESYSSAKMMARRHKRRDEAFDRQHEHDSLTLEEKLAKCKFRTKKGMGKSEKESARIVKLLVKKEIKKEMEARAAKAAAPATPATPAVKSESVQTASKKKYQRVKKS